MTPSFRSPWRRNQAYGENQHALVVRQSDAAHHLAIVEIEGIAVDIKGSVVLGAIVPEPIRCDHRLKLAADTTTPSGTTRFTQCCPFPVVRAALRTSQALRRSPAPLLTSYARPLPMPSLGRDGMTIRTVRSGTLVRGRPRRSASTPFSKSGRIAVATASDLRDAVHHRT